MTQGFKSSKQASNAAIAGPKFLHHNSTSNIETS